MSPAWARLSSGVIKANTHTNIKRTGASQPNPSWVTVVAETLLLSKRSWPFNRGAGWWGRGARPWVLIGLAQGVMRTNGSLWLRIHPASGRHGPGNALWPDKRKLHTLRSNLQPPGTTPEFRALQAGRGRNRERGPKLGLGDNLDSPTLAVPWVDPGTKNPDAGTNRVSGAMELGGDTAQRENPDWGERKAETASTCTSTFIHPQRLAPVGHRTGLKGRMAAWGNPRRPRWCDGAPARPHPFLHRRLLCPISPRSASTFVQVCFS